MQALSGDRLHLDLCSMDIQYRRNRLENSTVGMSCGACFVRWNGKERGVEVLLGQREKGFASFAGKAEDKDFGPGRLAPVQIAARKVEEELGLPEKDFYETLYKASTVFIVKNNKYDSDKDRFLAPVLFIEASAELERAVEQFQPNEEMRDLRWFNAKKAVEVSRVVAKNYQDACTTYREANMSRLMRQHPDATPERLSELLNSEIFQNPELKALLDENLRVRLETGEEVKIASYVGRTLDLAAPVFEHFEKMFSKPAEQKIA